MPEHQSWQTHQHTQRHTALTHASMHDMHECMRAVGAVQVVVSTFLAPPNEPGAHPPRRPPRARRSKAFHPRLEKGQTRQSLPQLPLADRELPLQTTDRRRRWHRGARGVHSLSGRRRERLHVHGVSMSMAVRSVRYKRFHLGKRRRSCTAITLRQASGGRLSFHCCQTARSSSNCSGPALGRTRTACKEATP